MSKAREFSLHLCLITLGVLGLFGGVNAICGGLMGIGIAGLLMSSIENREKS